MQQPSSPPETTGLPTVSELRIVIPLTPVRDLVDRQIVVERVEQHNGRFGRAVRVHYFDPTTGERGLFLSNAVVLCDTFTELAAQVPFRATITKEKRYYEVK